MKTASFSCIVTLLLLAGACSNTPQASSAEKIIVAATVSPITNLVDNVGGNAISLIGIVPEGADSHTFEPRPSDAKLLGTARLIFMNGLRLEEPILRLAKRNLRAGSEIIQLADRTINRDEWIFDFSFPESLGDPNPHLWTNPVYMKRYIEIIRDELSQASPSNSKDFSENAEQMLERISRLDRAIRIDSQTVPESKRKLLTYHDSFPYFAREYGWSIIGAIQPSDFSDPSPRDIGGLIEQIKKERVPAIFGSEVFPSPVLEQIAAESGALYVDNLRDDDLPAEHGSPEHSYLALMQFNFITIIEALGGDPSQIRNLITSNLSNTNAKYGR